MINNIQILRAYAAISVVMLHIAYPLIFGIAVGNFGVDVFFVISGFIMAHICATNPDQFLLRRLIRIAPIYWLLTIALFLVAMARPELLHSTKAEFGNLVKSLLFIPYPRWDGFFAPILVRGWTLNYEIYFYGLISVGLLFSRRYATIIASVLLILAKIAIEVSGATFLRFYSRDIVLEFVFGVVVYELIRKLKKDSLSRGFLATVFAISILTLIAFERVFTIDYHRALLLGIPAVLLVATAVLLERNSTSPAKKFGVLLGDASYMIYLTHPYVMEPAQKLLSRVGGWLDPTRFAGAMLVTSAAVAAGVAVHLGLEKPILNVLKRPLARTKKAAALKPAKVAPILVGERA